jgi:hypothetical protein
MVDEAFRPDVVVTNGSHQGGGLSVLPSVPLAADAYRTMSWSGTRIGSSPTRRGRNRLRNRPVRLDSSTRWTPRALLGPLRIVYILSIKMTFPHYATKRNSARTKPRRWTITMSGSTANFMSDFVLLAELIQIPNSLWRYVTFPNPFPAHPNQAHGSQKFTMWISITENAAADSRLHLRNI